MEQLEIIKFDTMEDLCDFLKLEVSVSTNQYEVTMSQETYDLFLLCLLDSNPDFFPYSFYGFECERHLCTGPKIHYYDAIVSRKHDLFFKVEINNLTSKICLNPPFLKSI